MCFLAISYFFVPSLICTCVCVYQTQIYIFNINLSYHMYHITYRMYMCSLCCSHQIESERLSRMVGIVNRLRPKFLLVTGDMTHAPPGHEFYEGQVKEERQNNWKNVPKESSPPFILAVSVSAAQQYVEQQWTTVPVLYAARVAPFFLFFIPPRMRPFFIFYPVVLAGRVRLSESFQIDK